MVEYALILGLISIVSLTALTLVSTSLQTLLDEIAAAIVAVVEGLGL
jgi:Flp pilus assembly pilin Flp